jgi:CHAT domain-containing protein
VDVWNALLLSRDRVFRECAERRALLRASASPDLDGARDRLGRARRALAGLYVRSRRGRDPAAFAEAIARARSERDAYERDLTAGMDVAPPPSAPTLGEIARALEPGSGLVRYCLADRPTPPPRVPTGLFFQPCYYACVLAPGSSKPRILELGAQIEIDGLVRELVREIRAGAGAEEHVRIAAELRRRLLDPVLEAMPGARLVLLVPEFELTRVPFQALCSDSGAYVAETGPTLHVLGSEEDLVRSAADAGRGLLALGDPDFASAREAASRFAPGVGNLRSLPATRVEIAFVVDAWNRSRFASEPVVRLLGGDATEASFRRHASGRRILHVATHGYYDDGGDPESGDVSNGEGLRGPSRPSASVEAGSASFRLRESTILPLLRSGLVFGGAPEAASEDDGILTTEELQDLDLTGVDWVVLSACDTGIGEIRRFEGVLGLQRAMRLAGARTVVTSLWEVEDRWAGAWMEALYRARLDRGLSTAEAVRAASLEVLGDLRRTGEEPLPRRWASFVAVGDWR